MSDLNVPMELIDFILNNLATDSASLKLCALVCRSWLPPVRRLLFRSMILCPSTDYKGLVDLWEDSPGIRACIRSLTVFKYNNFDYSLYPGVDTFYATNAPDSLESLELLIHDLRDDNNKGVYIQVTLPRL